MELYRAALWNGANQISWGVQAYMTSRQRRELDKLLAQKDGQVCGIHIGGCGKETHSRSETDLDHIFPQAFFRDTKVLHPREYDKLWNLQRMHKSCNNETKGGFLFGFPVFKCVCHWLQIKHSNGKYALEISYCPTAGEEYRAIVVPYGKFDVGEGTVSDPKGLLPTGEDHVLAGFIRSPDRGMSISSITVDVEAAFSSGRKSFSFVGKAKKGVLGRGKNAHTFPLLAPEEVTAFNQFEQNRVKHGGKVDNDDNLLASFNSEVVHLEIKYGELVSDAV